MDKEHYGFIELFRDVNASDNIVEQDLKKLSEFIRHRASKSKDIEYYTVTFMKRDNVSGFIIVKGVVKEKVDYEVELLEGFIESSLEAITARVIKKFKKNNILPIPITGNF